MISSLKFVRSTNST